MTMVPPLSLKQRENVRSCKRQGADRYRNARRTKDARKYTSTHAKAYQEEVPVRISRVLPPLLLVRGIEAWTHAHIEAIRERRREGEGSQRFRMAFAQTERLRRVDHNSIAVPASSCGPVPPSNGENISDTTDKGIMLSPGSD